MRAGCRHGSTRRAAHKIRSQTDDHAAEEAAATAHAPLLPRAQHGCHHFPGGPGMNGGRFRDSSNGRSNGAESGGQKPADTQRRRQCEEALVETLRGLVRAATACLRV